MEEWTVVLKKPDGFTFEVIEADYAEWTDDGTFLNFRNVQAGKEGLKALATLPKNPTTEQLQDFVIDLFKAMGQITAASFERESVAGFFRGRRATLDVHLEPKSDDHF